VEGEESARQEECTHSIVTCREDLKQATAQLHYLKNMALGRLGIGGNGAAAAAGGGGGAEATSSSCRAHPPRICPCPGSTVRVTDSSEGAAGDSSSPDTMESADCVVCMECLSDGDVCVLACGHDFHRECIDWILDRASVSAGSSNRNSKSNQRNKQLKCPVCRIVSREEDIIQAAQHGDTLTTPQTQLQQPQCHSLAHHSQQAPSSSSSTVVLTTSTPQVKGDWGTKITAVVSDLLDLKQTMPRAQADPPLTSPSLPLCEKLGGILDENRRYDIKSIVFSQWDQMLDICAAALQTNGIEYEKIGGQGNSSKRHFEKSLARFHSDPFVSVLLLPLKSCAQGLTLVEATHVFFLEPMLNLEQEAQAVNRIHRIGQESETFVHKYIIRQTVEEHIYRLYEDRVRKEKSKYI
jgi:hypothetical protein